MSASVAKYFRFEALLQKDGWLSPAYVGVDEKGSIQFLSNQPPPEGIAFEAVMGFALPGFKNSHSHAFQYAMAGLAENHLAGTEDDFWTWREEMYKCALLINPEEAECIATMLYAEMLRHGYTHVAEFHYLHHDKDGRHYANLAEMGERMVAAAKRTGIKITLIPVFYQKGGFGLEPQSRQKRFISRTIDEYFELLDSSLSVIKIYDEARLGFSVHSLRAVELADTIRTAESGPKDLPFHIHIAEQKKEVNDCLAFCGLRPMQWLLEKLHVNERFHLVHATHLDDHELKGLAASGAHAVLCPSTEGNLGDGIFRMKEYCQMGGHWSIGTDSHIGLNPYEEFRMIDYHQRLVLHRRNTFKGDAAHYMINAAMNSGAQAMGLTIGNNFETGMPFDAVIIDGHSPLFGTTPVKNLLATILYTGDVSSNLGTIVNGKWVVRQQHHLHDESIKTDFIKVLNLLKNR